MINYKEYIGRKISEATNVDVEKISTFIEVPKDSNMGDYAFPCFRLAKELKKSPQLIANDIKEKIVIDNNIIEKIEIVGGYLNFYLNKINLVENVLKEIDNQKDNYGSKDIGKGKNVVIDYSSPNIAKPFHIGHLRSTVIGGALYKMYEFIGYNVIGVNHLGDWGTQFAKLIEGYKRWGQEYDIDANPIDELTKIYIRINALCKEDETVLEMCRENFKKLEEGDEYCVQLWEKFREVSLKEFQRIYDILGSKFDSWNGEAFYRDKTDEVIEILEATGKLIESEGAKVIDLENKGMPPCIVCKSNGSTIYATRDLAAILYRARTYDFEKAIYVTSYEQILHFKQIFEVAKLLGLDKKYTDNLIHVPFGMVQLKTGKMSTREGTIIKLEDLLNEAIARVREIVENKTPDLENKEENIRKIAIGAVIFNDLSNSRIKDEIFDWDIILNFQGETGPYIQYMYVRTKSVLEKVGKIPDIQDVKFENLLDTEAVNVIKKLYDFTDNVISAIDKNEPSILSRYLINLSQCYSSFYNANKIIVEDEDVRNARVYLTYAVGNVLKIRSRFIRYGNAR